MTIASRTPLVVADIVLIVITWRCTWPEWKLIQRANLTAGGIGMSLYGVLLRDGNFYDK